MLLNEKKMNQAGAKGVVPAYTSATPLMLLLAQWFPTLAVPGVPRGPFKN